jgi:hypothetical protein
MIKNMKKLVIILISFSTILQVISCQNNEVKQEQSAQNQVDTLNKTIAQQDEILKDFLERIGIDSSLKVYFDSLGELEKEIDYVPYYFENEGKKYFVVVKGQWNEPKDTYVNVGNFKVGLINDKKEIIIPISYNRIYNLGGTIPNLMEVENDLGKKGLYQLNGKEVVKTEYDGIYPFEAENVLAQVKKGENYGWVDKEGKEYFDSKSHSNKELFISPFKSGRVKNWKYKHNKNNQYFINTKANETDLEGSGIYFTPSYWKEVGFLPAIQTEITIREEERFGKYNFSLDLLYFNEKFQNIFLLISEYYEEISNAREYSINKKQLIIYEKEVLKIKKEFNYGMIDNVNITLLEDNYIEIEFFKDCDCMNYNKMNTYQYFTLNNKGELSKENTNRFYTFTKFIKISEKYYKNKFIK